MYEKHQRVRELLLEKCEEPDVNWRWLADDPGLIDRKGANKFLLGARIDYGIKAGWAWESAGILADTVLGDPDDIWSSISSMTPSMLWAVFRGEHTGEDCRRCAAGHKLRPKENRHKALHMWPKQAAENVQKMSNILSGRYGGDGRQIWQNRTTDEIRCRLRDATFGPQLSNMVVLALIATGHVDGRASLKADLNVNRVLGRVFTGETATPVEAQKMADVMEPGNSHIFDSRLYILGQDICTARRPNCTNCCLKDECEYYDVHRTIITLRCECGYIDDFDWPDREGIDLGEILKDGQPCEKCGVADRAKIINIRYP